MLERIKKLLLCGFALLPAQVAQAEVAAASACTYFALTETKVMPNVSQSLLLGTSVRSEPYELVSTELERYQTWAIPNILRSLIRIGTDGEEIPTAVFSVRVDCLVDIVDRRVLKISYENGPSVGKTLVSLEFSELANIKNPALKLVGVVPQTYEVGNETHQGKY